MTKIEIDIETLQEMQAEMRQLRVTNMELKSQLDAVKRLLASIHVHLPSDKEVEYTPGSIAKINKAIEMQKSKLEEQAKLEESKKLLPENDPK